MIRSIRRKITLAGIAVMMLLITAVTTTYAWFSLNDSAWIEGLELDIEANDSLLISADGVNFKQSLTNADVVVAINRARTSGISGLEDINLAPVTSLDGENFNEFVVSYDENNKQALSYKAANINHYVQMKLSFMVEGNSTLLPDYDFKFITASNGDLNATSFSSENQSLTLFNSLVNGANELKSGDKIAVNPVNALRVSVTKSDGTTIYDVAKSGLAKATTGTLADDLGGNAFVGVCDTNPMYTYFNNIHNGILSPMGDITCKTSDHFNDSLGVFTYDDQASSYNVIDLTLCMWIEGFDADNLVGLDTSSIKVLLSFEAVSKN